GISGGQSEEHQRCLMLLAILEGHQRCPILLAQTYFYPSTPGGGSQTNNITFHTDNIKIFHSHLRPATRVGNFFHNTFYYTVTRSRVRTFFTSGLGLKRTLFILSK